MEYNEELYVLNKICEFKNKQTELNFREYEKTASLGVSRFIILFMGIIFFAFVLSDYYFYGKQSTFIFSLIFRGFALILALITFFMAGSFKQYNHTLIMLILTVLAVFALYLVNLYILKANQIAIQFMTIMIFLLAVFLIPNLWKNSVIGGIIIWAGYIIFSGIFGSPEDVPSLNQRGIYLGISLVACAIFLHGRESSRRRQYAVEKHLEFMSITDRLTGIYNRGRFEYVLGLWIKNMRHDPFCLILFDIDNFKKVNDQHGHSAGDQVLIKTTEIITAHIRDNDIFARWGGEEFVVLFSNTDIDRAADLAERLRKAVESNDCGEAGKITISIGVAKYQRTETILNFINRADEKMYEAKKAGKNCVIVADPLTDEATGA